MIAGYGACMYASQHARTTSPPTTPPSTPVSVIAAGAFAAATVAAAVGGSLINQGAAMDWYDGLDKPFFTPPDATFGIVWTILYVMIGISGWLGWRAAANADVPIMSWSQPSVWWGIQIVLNFAWTAVFFGAQAPVGGLFVIAALIAAIVVDIAVVRRFSTVAAWLLVPYLAWCCYAAALNVGVVALN
jgi:benzodiazapine receptor